MQQQQQPTFRTPTSASLQASATVYFLARHRPSRNAPSFPTTTECLSAATERRPAGNVARSLRRRKANAPSPLSTLHTPPPRAHQTSTDSRSISGRGRIEGVGLVRGDYPRDGCRKRTRANGNEVSNYNCERHDLVLAVAFKTTRVPGGSARP